MNLTVNANFGTVLDLAIKKAFELKNIEPFIDEEYNDFLDKLSEDEEFVNSCKNIVQVTRN